MPAMEKNIAGSIFLVGLMGAGKTSLGRQLALRLHYPFYDSDQVICEQTGVSVATIFDVEGEDGFRGRERQTLERLTALPNIVLATGGGAVLHPDNRGCLKTRGTVVYLHVAPDILFERTRYDKNRPLLQVDNPLQKLQDLYAVRDPVYREAAHIVLDVGEAAYHATLEQLWQALTAYFSGERSGGHANSRG